MVRVVRVSELKFMCFICVLSADVLLAWRRSSEAWTKS
ncbi:hypothetical protein LINPERPRIM_LOCUS11010 [Linum perenne]